MKAQKRELGKSGFSRKQGVALAVVSALSLLGGQLGCLWAEQGNPVAARKAMLQKELRFVGDYQGIFKQRNGKKTPLVAQVIALGKGRFHANILSEFDKRIPTSASLEGLLSDDGSKVQFYGWGDISAYCGPDWQGVIEGDTFKGSVSSRHGGPFELEKVVRLSPTLGAKPPQGAVVLFDGANFDEWQGGRRGGRAVKKKLDGDAMVISPGGTISTKRMFTYFKLHVEFRTPFLPQRREQGRGNSGVFVQNREIQVLDSYGLGGRSKECGGIYGRRAPLVNMCAPPMQWQTYDVTIQKPGADGKSRMTVLQNGVVIHDHIEIGGVLRPTYIRLQDHGNPVEYRNIWLVETP